MESHEKFGRGLFLGTLVFGIGIIVRANARKLAWPTDYSYSGAHESTAWAFAEEIYSDIGRALMLLGCGFFVALFYRWLSQTTSTKAETRVENRH